jgi:hypothetical protein
MATSSKNVNPNYAIIKGTVTDDKNNPIVGAFVSVKNTPHIAVLTTSGGRFSLAVPPGETSLSCYAMGYELNTKTISADLKNVNFSLSPEKTTFEELITPTSILAKEFDPQGNYKGGIAQDIPLTVKLSPVGGKSTTDKELWDKIGERSIDFNEYSKLMDKILTCDPGGLYSPSDPNDKKIDKNHLPFNRTEAYSLLKFATERYVEKKLGLTTTVTDYFKTGRLPYYDIIISRINEFFTDVDDTDSDCNDDLLVTKDQPLLIELIWSYWHEEGMLVQTMNAITRRFQNIRNNDRDPLANLELDPLRPLNNILWGYIQDIQHRLTISRRTYEYDHHYGIRLLGKAIPEFMPADSRSKFIQSFHNLLYRASLYFKEADDMTINADAFPLLNALRETHLLLAEGAHNQFGDLPAVARIEMLMEQWILARPEIREFLGGRIMVPYDETWMDRVDTMKTLQGWTDTSISYYHDLAVYGEQVILSVRYGNWSRVNDRDSARNWADRWRDAIQRYLHSYHSVTGVDLTLESYNQSKDEKYIMPAFLIQQKVQREKALKRG